MQTKKPDFYNNLDKTYEKIWDLLNKGLADRNNPFHIPVFICGSKMNIGGRIVVLRGFDKRNKNLFFHSDIRSNKINLLKSQPQGTFLFYDKIEKIQLRISCKMNIHYQNDKAKESWINTAHMSRQCYLGNIAPGSDCLEPTSGLSEDIDNSKYTLEESEVGFKNFCVLEGIITSIEWLYLASKGHRRAKFSFKDNHVDKKWLIP